MYFFLSRFRLALLLFSFDSLIGLGSMILIDPFSCVANFVKKSWTLASNLAIWSLWCFIVTCKPFNANLLDSWDCISNTEMRSFWILTISCSSSIFFQCQFPFGVVIQIIEWNNSKTKTGMITLMVKTPCPTISKYEMLTHTKF